MWVWDLGLGEEVGSQMMRCKAEAGGETGRVAEERLIVRLRAQVYGLGV